MRTVAFEFSSGTKRNVTGNNMRDFLIVFSCLMVVVLGTVRGETELEDGETPTNFMSAVEEIGQNHANSVLFKALQAPLVRVPRQLMAASDQQMKDVIIAKFQSQCKAAKNEQAAAEAVHAAEKLETCIKAGGIEGSSDFSVVCASTKKNIHNCMMDYNSKIKPCLNKSSEYIPDFSLEMIDSVFNYLCEGKGENFQDLFGLMFDPCAQQLNEPLATCAKDMELLKNRNTADIPKDVFCRDLNLMKQCAQKSARNLCQAKSAKTITSLTEAIYAPCTGCNLSVTSLFVICALSIFAKLF